MGNVRLIRFANDGFKNYHQPHVHAFKEKVECCYAFIEKYDSALLSYKESYAEQNENFKFRINEKKNELLIDDTTLIYVRNKKIDENRDHIYFNKEGDFVIIPEELIQKTGYIGEIEFPLTADMYVKVPAAFAKKQLETLFPHYEWIKAQVKDHDDVSINTRVIDYIECIVSNPIAKARGL